MKTTLTSILKKEIQDGKYDICFNTLAYSDIKGAKERYIEAITEFEKHFGEDKNVLLFSAPGRTELSGNHTDHQGGCVLCGSVNLDTIAVVSPRCDTKVTVVSHGYEPFSVDISDLEAHESEKSTSMAIVRGMAKAINEKTGAKLCGFDAYTMSQVPKGSGLSSSAAFEILIGKIFSTLCLDNSLESSEIAEMGHFAENVYFGKPCGKMDQYACATGGIVFIDFKTPVPSYESVNVSFSDLGYTLFITDAGGNHANLTPEYAAVPAEMREIAKCFGKEKLSEVSFNDFYRELPTLREKLSHRALSRALHYFKENDRVKKQLDALKKGDIKTYLDLMQKSGDSSLLNLQNIYPMCDATERSLSLALGLSLDFGEVTRVHGGGFAGTIQALVKNERADEYKDYMERIFGKGKVYAIAIRSVGGYCLGEEK